MVGRRLGPGPWALRFPVRVKEQKAREVPTLDGGPQGQALNQGGLPTAPSPTEDLGGRGERESPFLGPW